MSVRASLMVLQEGSATIRGKTLADTHDRPASGICDGVSQNLMCMRRGVSLAQEHETQYVCDGIPFFPFEVCMRHPASVFFEMHE